MVSACPVRITRSKEATAWRTISSGTGKASQAQRPTMSENSLLTLAR